MTALSDINMARYRLTTLPTTTAPPKSPKEYPPLASDHFVIIWTLALANLFCLGLLSPPIFQSPIPFTWWCSQKAVKSPIATEFQIKIVSILSYPQTAPWARWLIRIHDPFHFGEQDHVEIGWHIDPQWERVADDTFFGILHWLQLISACYISAIVDLRMPSFILATQQRRTLLVTA